MSGRGKRLKKNEEGEDRSQRLEAVGVEGRRRETMRSQEQYRERRSKGEQKQQVREEFQQRLEDFQQQQPQFPAVVTEAAAAAAERKRRQQAAKEQQDREAKEQRLQLEAERKRQKALINEQKKKEAAESKLPTIDMAPIPVSPGLVSPPSATAESVSDIDVVLGQTRAIILNNEPTQIGEIFIDVDADPSSLLPPKVAGNPNINMGADAALSGVVTGARNYINYLKDNAAQGDLDIKRDDAGPEWQAMLSGKPLAPSQFLDKTRIVVSGLPFVKAIMDSACLGESVCVCISNNYCQSMKEFNDKIFEIYSSQECLPLLDFLLHMSYCDVFELCSSDILGAVNGLFSVRAIINTLPCMSYISIPKGAGGQLGTDSDVYLFSLLLHHIFYPRENISTPHSFDSIPLVFSQAITLWQKDTTINTPDFENTIEQFRKFEQNYPGGICDKQDVLAQNHELCFRMMEYLKYFSDKAFEFKSTGDYTSLIEALRNNNLMMKSDSPKEFMYETDRKSIIRENLVWFSFQMCRYIQATKFLDIQYHPLSSSHTVNKEYLLHKKHLYATNLRSQVGEFQKLWLEILRLVAINESFAGHDNKSISLLELGTEVYRDRLGWTEIYLQKGLRDPWKPIHSRIIRMIQGQTDGIFFQYSPVPNLMKTERGVLFSLNTNLLDIGAKIGGKSTSDGAAVYELFVNNVGSQNINLIVDLEKYTGEQANDERGQTVIDLLTMGILTKRIEYSKDRFQEFIGVISSLDRASRTPHPRAIYCDGCLNIPFQLKDGIKINIKFKKYQNNTQDVPECINVGLNNYSLYTFETPTSGQDIYNEIIREVTNRTSLIYDMALLLTYLVKNIDTHWKEILKGVKEGFSGVKKHSLPQELKGSTAIQAGKVVTWAKEIIKISNQNDEAAKQILVAWFENFIDLMNEGIKGYKGSTAQRLAYLVGRNEINIASAFIEIYGKKNMEGTLQGNYYFIDMITGGFTPKIGTTNSKNATPPIDQAVSSFHETTMASLGPGIGIADLSSDMTVVAVAQSDVVENLTSMVGEEGEDAIEAENIGKQPEDSELLLTSLVLADTLLDNIYKQQAEKLREQVQTDIANAFAPPPLERATFDILEFNGDQLLSDDVIETQKKLEELRIRKAAQEIIRDKLLLYGKELKAHIGRTSYEDVLRADYLQEYRRIQNLWKKSSEEVGNIETQIQTLIKEDTLESASQFWGGQKQDIKKLVGKTILYKYDKKQNIYYIADFYEVFKLWFNKRYGSQLTQINSIKVAQPVIAKGLTSPVTKSSEWWKKAEQKIKSNQLYMILPQEQKDEKYRKIISKVEENIKTMDDDLAIRRAILSILKDTPIITVKDDSIKSKVLEDKLSKLGIPKKIESGTNINDMKNIIGFTNKALFGGRYYSTRRKKYKNKGKKWNTKRRVNKRIRKTKKRQLRRKRITRRR